MATQKMTDHPITPPPELVQQWFDDTDGILDEFAQAFAAKAARWGADTELDACCADLRMVLGPNQADWLHSVRRPKPPSLKEQALHALLHIDQGQHNERCHIIRRALEQLND